ncbi:MAG: tRNA (adenosine(37)-N6)-threonylcarbamoyltransferase complex ATPase subunit type 1 TsaE [bacterium]|nr:tRNA (adenosine(37)-N6)-threonylcarbamoyltransferase complex ATPase subunit type 1 TsaE [bacterium]
MNEDKVQSPTYTYINIYNKKLLHIDMYRLESFDDVLNKGILEEIHNYDYIVIERPKFEDQIDYSDFLKINIQKISDTERKLIL